MLSVDKRGIEEILMEQGIISIDSFKKVRELQKQSGHEIEEILLKEGLATRIEILKARAVKMQVDFVDLSGVNIRNSTVPKLIAGLMAKRYRIIPIEESNTSVTVAMQDPTDIFVLDDLKLVTAKEIKPVYADIREIERLIDDNYFPEKQFQAAQQARQQMTGRESGIVMNNDMEETHVMPDLPGIHGEVLPDLPGIHGEVHVEQPLMQRENQHKSLKMNTMKDIAEPQMQRDRLGRLMVRSGVITDDQLSHALGIQSKKGGMIGEILVSEGIITKKTLLGFLEVQIGVTFVDLSDVEIDEDVLKSVGANLCRRYCLIPIERESIYLKVAMSDPLNIFTVDDLRLATGAEIIPLLADSDEILVLLDKYYPEIVDEPVTELDDIGGVDDLVEASRPANISGGMDSEFMKINQEVTVEMDLEKNTESDVLDISNVSNSPIVKMVNMIFSKAVQCGTSDIHIEPYEDCVMLRYRVDGQLIEIMKYDKKVLMSLVSRIKIISGLNIAEKRLPQDGRITMKIENRNFDLRVSVLPTHFGEKIVIRISDKEGFQASKEKLGFFEDDLAKFEDIMSHPHGIVLVTGPTGSGKTTTLYAALRELAKPSVNVLTVEDPIENVVRGVNQVQVNVKAGLTFASALRSFLRQDPDIIMLGEIRDGETAEIATKAAITGHLVLSTLHTNDAPSSITRIIDMGIEPFMVSSSIVGVIAQRLVRRLCPKCKELYDPDESEQEILHIEPKEKVDIYRAVGCEACNQTGYKGRIAVYEIMTVNREIREVVARQESVRVLRDAALKNGMVSIRENCVRLVRAGISTVEELLKVSFGKE
jgi:type IV pilus assembly protein PilB